MSDLPSDRVLCCVDAVTAAGSLARIFDVTSDRFLEALGRAAVVARSNQEDPIRAIVSAVARELGAEPTLPETIRYFHGTRVIGTPRFVDDGLWPMSEMLDALWAQLAELAPEIEASVFREIREAMTAETLGSHTYPLRVNGAPELHDGPFGVLVRDVLLEPQAYNGWDYLSGPEIVDDICGAVREHAGIDLLARYRRASAPYIVEYTTVAEHVEGAMAAAIWYVEASTRECRTSNAAWCHDAEGTRVPPQAVIAVSPFRG